MQVETYFTDGKFVNYFNLINVNSESSTSNTSESTDTSESTNTSETSEITETTENPIGPSYNTTTSTAISQSCTGLAFTINLANSLTSTSSTQSAWTIVNMLQLILLLPLIAKSISSTVKNFILSNGFACFNIGTIIDIETLIGYKLIFTIKQPDEYLEDLGMESGSALVNNLSLIVMLLGFVILHLFIILGYGVTQKYEKGI